MTDQSLERIKKYCYRSLKICLIALLSNSKTIAQVNTHSDSATKPLEDVVLYSDPRLAVLSAYEEVKPASSLSANTKNIVGSIHSARGYRVLIYSGIDRAKATATKSDFMRRYPGIRVYMTYSLPQYKIKIGDYATRQEANELYRQLNSLYSPCMVVPDIVEINTFRKND
jgi:hypothetical protein